MGLMPESRIFNMIECIKTRSRKLFEANELELSSSEFIAAFIDQDHIEPLNKVQDLVGVVSNSYVATEIYANYGDGLVEQFLFGVNFHIQPPIILPKYVQRGPRPDAPKEILEKINVWLLERVRLGKIFGDAVDSLVWLNNNCKDIRAMRAMFPALTILLRDVATDEKSAAARMAVKLDGSKGVTNLPSLPREVTNDILQASNTIVATTLLDGVTNNATREKGSATFTLNAYRKAKHRNLFDKERTTGSFL